MKTSRRVVTAICAAAVLLSMPARAQQQSVPVGSTLGTVGSGIPGEGSTPGTRSAPNGPAPRLANGRPDFNGVWDHAYVPDMSLSARVPTQQKAPGPLPLTPAGVDNIKSYDPEKDGDYTGMCMPYGLTRSFNGPFPIQIMQTDKHVAFLFEMGTWFHVAPFKTAHSAEPNPTWFGESIARWDGDTLVVETNNLRGAEDGPHDGWLDVNGSPYSREAKFTERIRRLNYGHLQIDMTVEDPKAYTKPFTVRVDQRIVPEGELIEFICNENQQFRRKIKID